MLLDYLLTPVIIISLMTFWIGVQFAWKRFFPEQLTDEDVLAMRRKCNGCHLKENCVDFNDQCEKEILNNEFKAI